MNPEIEITDNVIGFLNRQGSERIVTFKMEGKRVEGNSLILFSSYLEEVKIISTEHLVNFDINQLEFLEFKQKGKSGFKVAMK